MSASYRLIGERRLRKYTEASTSPVYAAESEVKFISSHLCDVPWEPANGVRDARMTWHTSENVGDAEHPVSGLDRNVEIRDQFDAALFCAGHAGGSHRAYANAACYRYVLPDAAVGKTLESVVASVTSDPYNAVGARLALLTNSTGVIPTDCGLCRNGGRLVNGSYVQDPSYHTPEGGVAKRRSEGTGDAETWYPVTEDTTLEPEGFVLQKYLFVFVLLENYNFNRGNWIEGSSFIENRISVTINQAVDGWTEGSVIDLSGSASDGGVDVLRDGGVAVIPSGVRAVVVSCVPRCGVEFPERPEYVTSDEPGNASVWSADAPQAVQRSLTGSVVCSTPLNIRNFDAYGYPSTGHTTTVAGGLVASYRRDNSGTGALPGLSFYLAAYDQVADPSPASYTWHELPVFVSEAAVPAEAKEMLASGSVKEMFLVPWFRFYEFFDPEQYLPIAFTRHASVLILSDGTSSVVAGTLCNAAFSGKSSPTDAWVFFAFTNHFTVASPGKRLVSCALPVSRVTDMTSNDITVFCGNEVEGIHRATFDDVALTVTIRPGGQVPDDAFFSVWIEGEGEDHVILAASRMTSTVRVTGEGLHVTRAGFSGTVAGGLRASTTVVVTGRITAVGSVPYDATSVAIDMSVEGGDTRVLLDSGIVEPTAYDGSMRVIPVPSVGTDSPDVGFTALVSGRSGFEDFEDAKCLAIDGDDVALPPPAFAHFDETVLFSERFAVAVVGYGGETSRKYGALPIDELLTDVSGRSSSIGLRNCYAKLCTGDATVVRARQTGNLAANFNVVPGTRRIRITGDYGKTFETVDFPVWRLCASVVLVPFASPSPGMTASSVELSWDAEFAAGSRLNLWMKRGERVTEVPDEVTNASLYSADVTAVGGWELVGTVETGATSAVFPIRGGLKDRVATFLLSAWRPHETYNPEAPDFSDLGVGELDVDPDTGTVLEGEGSGWLPEIVVR